MQMVTWLKFSKCKNDVNHVMNLYCSVCQEFDDRLRGMRNYNAAFIVGATNLRCSSIKDHSKADMHTKVMSLYHEKMARSSVMESASIVRALNTVDKSLGEKMIKRFQFAYIIAREGIAVARMNSLCDLLERQGVDLCNGCRSNMAFSMFVDFIAEDLQLGFCKTLQSCKFFSVHRDGCTDAGNNKEEMFFYVLTLILMTTIRLFM